MRLWTIEEGVELIRSLRQRAHDAGFALALTGGVLMRGASDKDLDVIAYPLNRNSYSKRNLFAMLVTAGWRRVLDSREVRDGWHRHGSTDSKHVERWSFNDKRIDLFILT